MGGFLGSGGGGGGVTDPITVNGWAPAGGTASITGVLVTDTVKALTSGLFPVFKTATGDTLLALNDSDNSVRVPAQTILGTHATALDVKGPVNTISRLNLSSLSTGSTNTVRMSLIDDFGGNDVGSGVFAHSIDAMGEHTLAFGEIGTGFSVVSDGAIGFTATGAAPFDFISFSAPAAGAVSVSTAPFIVSSRIEADIFRLRGGIAPLVFTFQDSAANTLATLTDNGTTGTFASNILQSTVSTGTAPLTIASTTKVANLNADRVDDKGLLAGSATLDFPSIAAGATSDLTIAVTGASTAGSPPVTLGLPAAFEVNLTAFAFVSAADTVTVRVGNIQAAGAIDPASATFSVHVWQ